ncbi:exodeoxyribonuclease VII large subunit [Nakamurella deserti]|uniref:exodeoxyribonuclease VII large subunit n=1 Tax=Nakamurella deserti TaxID=2164074 RepID=UPI001F0B9ECC|nr:exodeoxyribonuclease VII large subunit [Nakamurella deserti]
MTTPAQRPPMAERAGETTRENPWPVRALSRRMAEYIARSPAAWIEGQLAQLSVRPGAATAFLTLRDPAADMSLSVSCSRAILTGLAQPLREGDRVVVYGKFEFYPARGSLSLRVTELHPVGLGELLARLQRIRELLAAEGLTAAGRKKTLPFLPRAIGLITGRASAAESDVLANARARWPAVEFHIENVAVQGVNAVQQIVLALRQLDADPRVDVIVLARGGGSVEDLLPFSDETLCRAVASCRTPVVSAIGHEPDHPIVDDVADLRCSTPTDAGKRIVPDVQAERRIVEQLHARARRSLQNWVAHEQARLAGMRSRAVLADPHTPILAREQDVERARSRARDLVRRRLDTETAAVAHRRSQLSALGPAATLQRGYAVVQAAGAVLRDTAQAPAGTALRIRVADGAVLATSRGAEPGDRRRPADEGTDQRGARLPEREGVAP